MEQFDAKYGQYLNSLEPLVTTQIEQHTFSDAEAEEHHEVFKRSSPYPSYELIDTGTLKIGTQYV